ncbi:MAG: putative ABC transporter ATP-binding protein YxlF [Phycisphaerae bacterium]|nr:putative ABC transporter ATP-binding protein YxlF [Phycisphaerae bacterium]
MTALHTTELTNWAVDLIDVHKTYRRKVKALRGVHVQVGRGEVFGLLGPNGAGKSTLVKIMMTVVHPDRALGTVLGRPIGHRGKLGRIGYLPENHRYPGYLRGGQLLDFYGAMSKVPRAQRRKHAAYWLERVGMKDWAGTRIREYSKGMMQRLGLAQALMNDPELLVLDEPTDGVDPVGRRDIRLLLTELKGQGKTILLNSHLLSEIELVCDRVAIMKEGLVARQGPLRDLTERVLGYRVRLGGDRAATAARIGSMSEKLAAMGARTEDHVVQLASQEIGRVNELIDLLRGVGLLIESVEPRRLSLEEVFVEVLGAGSHVGAARQG